MAVVGDRQAGCDGCGRTVALEELLAVTMPNGDQVVCCSDCEPHARTVARNGGSLDQCRDVCDGCTRTTRLTDLEDVVLDDGTVLTCCPSCVAETPGSNTEGADRSTAGASDSGVDSSPTPGDQTDAEVTRCSHCHESVSGDPFRITTIDERTEWLCHDCKTDAEERGIVATVDMQTSRACEILGVSANVTEDELRAAFHKQVKRAHPDRKSGSKSAFKLVTRAYERLRDAD
ncbi:J domain-containing protein [Natrinema halophilum]|uniref:J domain-containing protein n=1 Tax=Natrinema halophilum TaxID=1699371 RepID=A0A7D5GQK3_9EURY|nr:J domain-containing protein [Natrinema halophilum]QLG47809.1 J domain-containing protein [Natrinema halophilum]